MTWILAGIAISGWLVALGLLSALPRRYRRSSLRLALRLRSQVEPYLRRRLAQIEESSVVLPPQLPPHDPEQIVDSICDLSEQLLEHERAQADLGDTQSMAVSDTMPVPSPPGDPAA